MKNKFIGRKLGGLLLIIAIVAISTIKALGAWKYRPGENKYLVHIEAGREYMADEYYVEAIEEFRKADSIRPSCDAQTSIAECYLLLDDMNNFKLEADKVEQTYGTSERLYMDMVYYYDCMCDISGEIHILEEALKEFPDNEYFISWYDEIKGDFSVDGCTYDNVYALSNGYDIAIAGECIKLISGEANVIGNTYFEKIYDVYDGEELRISAYKDGQINYYDKNGYKRKPPEGIYEVLGTYRDGYALAKTASGWVYIDENGETTSEMYKEATAFEDGVAAVKTDEGWSLVGTDLVAVTDKKYEDIIRDSVNKVVFSGRIFVKNNDGYSMLDTNGNEISSGYMEVNPFIEEGGYAAVRDSEGWKVIDVDGNCIETVSCDELRASGHGLMSYRIGDFWGYIGVGDGVYVEPIFEDALRVNSEGYAAVKMNGQWTYIHFTKF